MNGHGVMKRMVVNNARVNLWGKQIGAVSWVNERKIGIFQYTPEFVKSKIEVSPLQMQLRDFPFEFPELNEKTFMGLPGLLADSLPDRYGNAIINEWLALQGRDPESFNPVERLCYVGKRGMGALEFEPSMEGPTASNDLVDVKKLMDLANRILNKRASLNGVFSENNDRKTIEDILRVGTSAGGARPKAILAWNPITNEFRSGQVEAGSEFEQWIMKFDGVGDDNDTELGNPAGYGKIEYTYYLIAKKTGINMSPCRLHFEGGRSHFMTKRFDRTQDGRKIHMQSLCAMAHYDYNQPNSYSYEQAIQVMKRLGLPREDLVQQVLRAIFNVVGMNRDDHVKNIAFLMDRKGDWRLSPAFDISYAWNPNGIWTKGHQMSVNHKREDIKRDELIELAETADIKRKSANEMIDKVIDSFIQWPNLAKEVGVSEDKITKINNVLQIHM